MSERGIDWARTRIGQAPDRVVASEVGCAVASVFRARKRIGISAAGKGGPRGVAHAIKSDADLGVRPHGELARRYGVSVSAVRKHAALMRSAQAPQGGRAQAGKSLHILQHALGLDDYGQGSWYRNHYVCGPGLDGYELCMAHVAAGRMVRHEPRALFGGDYCFVVTAAGNAYVREHSPEPKRMTRAQQRYRAWLRSGVDMPFGEWLREKQKAR